MYNLLQSSNCLIVDCTAGHAGRSLCPRKCRPANPRGQSSAFHMHGTSWPCLNLDTQMTVQFSCSALSHTHTLACKPCCCGAVEVNYQLQSNWPQNVKGCRTHILHRLCTAWPDHFKQAIVCTAIFANRAGPFIAQTTLLNLLRAAPPLNVTQTLLLLCSQPPTIQLKPYTPSQPKPQQI
jgi:hypothetical protein